MFDGKKKSELLSVPTPSCAIPSQSEHFWRLLCLSPLSSESVAAVRRWLCVGVDEIQRLRSEAHGMEE